MAQEIKDVTFGKPLRAAPDYIFNEADLTDTDVFTAGVALSDVFYPGNTQNRVAIVVEVDEAVATAVTTGALEIEYLYGDDFDQSITLLAVAAEAAIDAGEVIRFVPPAGWLPSPAKIQITHTDGTGTLSVFPIRIS